MDTIKYFCSDILHVTFYVDGEGHLIKALKYTQIC